MSAPVIVQGVGAEPVVFEARGRAIAGMYHAPAGPPVGTGIVLCNPFGYEAICSHRAYRALARRLSAEGFAVLRFDYDGTGDSVGDDLEPERVSAWKASVSAALDFVRARSGADRLGLFGARLGALLAGLVAAERGDVHSLVLWAPVISGRAWVRELRAFRMIQQAQRSSHGPRRTTDGDEAAGFALASSTVDELSQLDLTRLPRPPAGSVLVVPRDDLPSGEERLIEALAKLGSAVSRLDVPGYATLQLDPHESPVPAALIDGAARWLVQENPPRASGPATRDAHGPLANDDFVEDALYLEGPCSLFGIITRPARAPQSSLAVVFLNVGAVHHVGSNRMYVRMARRWAAEGICSLRFDLAGLGESPPPAGQPENRLYLEDAPAEVRAAMDQLTARVGATRFVLVGLCSGSYVAYYTTQVDDRIAAQVLINPQTYRWHPGDGLQIKSRKAFRSSRYYRKTAWRRETWTRLLRGDIRVGAIARELLTRGSAALKARALELVGRGGSEVAQALRAISDRGIITYFLFSGEDGGIDALEEHLGPNVRKLRGRANVRHEVIDGPDHTFTPMWSQVELERRLTAFVQDLAGQATPRS